jgi:hypothetical protein
MVLLDKLSGHDRRRVHRRHRRDRCGRTPAKQPVTIRQANRWTNARAVSATSRQPLSIVSACPRPSISMYSVTPSALRENPACGATSRLRRRLIRQRRELASDRRLKVRARAIGNSKKNRAVGQNRTATATGTAERRSRGSVVTSSGCHPGRKRDRGRSLSLIDWRESSRDADAIGQLLREHPVTIWSTNQTATSTATRSTRHAA